MSSVLGRGCVLNDGRRDRQSEMALLLCALSERTVVLWSDLAPVSTTSFISFSAGLGVKSPRGFRGHAGPCWPRGFCRPVTGFPTGLWGLQLHGCLGGGDSGGQHFQLVRF